jgi:hypothetical protein
LAQKKPKTPELEFPIPIKNAVSPGLKIQLFSALFFFSKNKKCSKLDG